MMMQERTDIPLLHVTALPPSTKWRVTVGWLSLLALAVLGFFLVLLLTPYGVGVSPDSMAYIEGARSLLRSTGYAGSMPDGQMKPITHFPPLFSSFLALIGLSGIDPWNAGRWLHAFLMGVNIFLTGHLVKRYANGSLAAVLLAGVLVLVSYDILKMHIIALSEPLFITLILLGNTFILRYLDTRKTLLFVASASVMSLAFLTRYFAAPLIGATAFSIFFLKTGSVKTRFRDSVGFLVLAVVPTMCWSARNKLVSGQTADMLPTSINDFPRSLLGDIGTNCASWFLIIPGVVPAGLIWMVNALALFLFLYALFLLVQRIKRDAASKTAILFIAFQSIFYILFYFFVCIFLASDCENAVRRYMTPLYPLGVLLLVLAIIEHLRLFQKHRRFMLLGPLLGIMVVVMVGKNSFNRLWKSSQSDGYGTVSKVWRESETMEIVRNLPDDAFIISNAQEEIRFLTGIPTALFPVAYDYHRNDQPFDNYDTKMERLRQQCTNVNCFVVVFEEGRKRKPFLVAPEKMVRELGLTKVLECKDGSIYKPKQ